MTEKKKSVLTWASSGPSSWRGVLAGRCAPSGAEGEEAPAAASDIAVAAHQNVMKPIWAYWWMT